MFRIQRRKASRFARLSPSDHPSERGVTVTTGALKGSGQVVVQGWGFDESWSPGRAKQFAESHWSEEHPMPDGTIDLHEAGCLIGKPAKVDLAGGLISDVKIIGFCSTNGRDYTPGALRGAVKLYEGAKVNLDHSTQPGAPRSVADRFGKFTGVHFVEGDGIRGDLRFNPEHPRAKQIAWFAEHMPDAIGASHFASGRATQKNGRLLVEEITSVKHVDLVADPATTSGLYEHQDDASPLAAQIAAILRDKSLTQAAKTRRVAALTEQQKPNRDDQMEDIKDLTLDMIEAQRPDLIKALGEKSKAGEEVKALIESVKTLKAENDTLKAAQAVTARRAKIDAAITEAKLPKEVVTETFIEQLVEAKDDATVTKLIEDRKAIAGTAVRAKSAPLAKEKSLAESSGSSAGKVSLPDFVNAFKHGVPLTTA